MSQFNQFGAAVESFGLGWWRVAISRDDDEIEVGELFSQRSRFLDGRVGQKYPQVALFRLEALEHRFQRGTRGNIFVVVILDIRGELFAQHLRDTNPYSIGFKNAVASSEPKILIKNGTHVRRHKWRITILTQLR